LSITDNLGCVFLDTIEITGPDTLDAQILPSHISCFGYINGSALASPTGGIPPYRYAWSTGGNNALVQGLSAGTYNLTVTDSNNCIATNSVVILQPPQLITTLQEKQVSCFNGSDGVATSMTQGGTPGYLYNWSTNPPQQAATAFGLSAGTYRVTVTDGNGCQTDGFVTVTQPDSIRWDLEVRNPTCYGYFDGWAVVTLSGGIPGYQVNWGIQKAPDVWMATGLNAGLHLFPVMDSRNCLDTVPVLLGQPNPLPSPTVFDDTICAGDRAALKGMVQGEKNSVCWSFTASDQYPIFCGKTYLTDALYSTRYYFAQTVDDIGCKGAMIPVLVTVNPIPSVEFEADKVYNELPNAVFSFYPTDTFPEIVSWLWELGDGNTSLQREPVHQYSETGHYTVKVTAIDSNGCKAVVEKIRYVEVGRTVFLVAPNAFSPNGDGVNDFFSISHRFIQSFTIKMFDRWGNMIYTSDNPNFRWDGSLNGQPLPEGAYVFTVYGLAADGTPVELSGSVTLIR
jgi:gliding motility-associated-like protein